MQSYKKAGVNKEMGYAFTELIKKDIAKSRVDGVIGNLGGFAGMMELKGYKQPVLVAGTDGVGTKLLLAKKYDCWDSIGIDCFAMCANDVLCMGARPLFFLDYLACGHLDKNIARRIVKGVIKACSSTKTALLGGETAEMPGFYAAKDYDIAGFCVGVMEKSRVMDKNKIQKGDILLGITASGFHSNGFSLLRKVIDDMQERWEGRPIFEHLLEPTKIYVNPVLDLYNKVMIKGMAHITGGGLIENVPRMLPESMCAEIQKNKIKPSIVSKMVKQLPISEQECWNTFNMGIGFVLVVEENQVQKSIDILKKHGEDAFVIGALIKKKGSQAIKIV